MNKDEERYPIIYKNVEKVIFCQTREPRFELEVIGDITETIDAYFFCIKCSEDYMYKKTHFRISKASLSTLEMAYNCDRNENFKDATKDAPFVFPIGKRKPN